MSDSRKNPLNPLAILEDDAAPEPRAPACFPSASRREAVRQIGGWLIFAGVLGAADGCGPTPASTKTSATCSCGVTTGSNTGLKKTDIPVNGVAYHPQQAIFICHDSAGFYALDSLCT
ncbi:MAG TPA: hypothetical protein VMV18_04620, partial [bacterium]|nr:hypothetical protein [bacterium]